MKVCVIPVDVREKPYLKDIGPQPGNLKKMQDIVAGGHNTPSAAYIERVWMPHLVDTPHSGLVMYVNDNGRAMYLPRNVRAEAFYPHDRICGQVFLTYEEYIEAANPEDSGVESVGVEDVFLDLLPDIALESLRRAGMPLLGRQLWRVTETETTAIKYKG